MQLAKSITPKKIKTLHCFYLTLLVLLFTAFTPVSGQDNSPYSRYGLGDLVPSTHINSRGMAGVSAGFSDAYSVNFSNPASFAYFQSGSEAKSKKLTYGRAILDVGINFENRNITQTSPAGKFKASNSLFSYLQVGMPIKKDWGISFGLRPVSRISYKMVRNERLKDPLTGLPIDSAQTRFEGDGGSYLASLGTGLKVFKKTRGDFEESLSLGISAGYYFGKKDISTRRALINDTVAYYNGNFQTKTNFNNIWFNAGLQYKLPMKKKGRFFTAGLFGDWGQKLNATQDRIRETFVFDQASGYLRLDSVSDVKNIKGTIVMPSSVTAGFVIQQFATTIKEGGWMVGVDFNYQNWSKYRFYDQVDSVKNKWEIRVGAQLNPVPKKNYFSNASYRFGFFTGPDYISVQQKLPQFGVTMGVGLPMRVVRNAPNQTTFINLSLEYIRRGNNNNLLKENLFRLSAGFSLSDFWFFKRKYD